MTKSIIDFNDFSVTVIRSARRKTLALEVGPHGVVARAPKRMSERSIKQFLHQKSTWISNALITLSPPSKPLALVDGAEVQYRGETFNLLLKEDCRGPVNIDNGNIVIPFLPSHLPREQSIKNKLIQWYKKSALADITSRVYSLADEMSVPTESLKKIKVRDYKRRWGSCDANGVLTFNWRIIKAPTEVSDYVLVHELAHCHEFNHSAEFWKVVEKQMPDWKVRQHWFHQHGGTLYRF